MKTTSVQQNLQHANRNEQHAVSETAFFIPICLYGNALIHSQQVVLRLSYGVINQATQSKQKRGGRFLEEVAFSSTKHFIRLYEILPP